MATIDEAALIEKLRRIEALHAGATTPGERDAAASAKQRILARLAEEHATSPPVDFKFSIADPWSRQVFNALARRYGLTPFRRRGQHQQTVMLKVSTRFVRETLWPEYLAIAAELHQYLREVTERVIREALDASGSEADEVAALASGEEASGEKASGEKE
jgi:hypothetical protein